MNPHTLKHYISTASHVTYILKTINSPFILQVSVARQCKALAHIVLWRFLFFKLNVLNLPAVADSKVSICDKYSISV